MCCSRRLVRPDCCRIYRRGGPSGFATFQKLAKAAGQRGRDTETSLSHLLERLSVAVRSAHARAVLRRAGGVDDLTEDAVDATASVLMASI